ncbi:MAG: glycosyltransferase family 4 protein [Cyanothece sp. SIO1E1]|nr:glycosyltransferase family 4 protein [Cyanothece sp. SIO1E1]
MSKLLFVTMQPFYPDSSGGAQQSSLYLFDSLRRLGWQIEVLCGLRLRSPYVQRACWQSIAGLRWPPQVIKDEDLGYPCWRRMIKFSQTRDWLKWLQHHLQTYQPDVVLGHTSPHCPLLNHAARQGYASFYFARELSSLEAGVPISDQIHVIANSPFSAAAVASVTCKQVGVVLPFVDSDQYRVLERDRRYITFINPVPEKGVEVAIKIAHNLPQAWFLFVKGKWSRYKNSSQEAFIKTAYSLPNVEIWPHQKDMRQVYSMTDILLMPSQFSETFGRVIIEAQANRIPVVAADVGGIPYTLGAGGILVKPKNHTQGYVDALQQLRADDSLYARLSAQAFENSQRPEFKPRYQVQRFIDFIESQSLAIR